MEDILNLFCFKIGALPVALKKITTIRGVITLINYLLLSLPFSGTCSKDFGDSMNDQICTFAIPWDLFKNQLGIARTIL